ncbi:MAG: DUF29 domain-containing protein [bacterium]
MLNVKEKPIAGTITELYNTDYYTWAMTNAELLMEGRFDEIDYINLAEEVKDLGNSEYYRLVSFFANLLSHLYKWDNQPDLRTKSWKVTVINSILDIALTIKRNPGLKNKLIFNEIFLEGWKKARTIIYSDTELEYIPKESPYTFKDAINKASDIAGDRIDKSDVSFLNNIF